MDQETNTPKMPVFPDGIGLDFDQIRQLIADKNKTIIEPDDPLLMVATICNAFLEEENKLMNRHKSALAQVLSSKTEKFVESVQSAAENMGTTLSSSSAVKFKQILIDHRIILERHKSNMMWLTAIAAVSALVNVAVFVALYLMK